MNFDEVRALWDSQHPNRDGSRDEQLAQDVIAKARSLDRWATVTEVLMVATLLFVAAMFFRDPLWQGHDLVLILPGIACVVAACFVWRWRYHRLRRQETFDGSLIGMIDKSLDAVADRIALMRHFLWWFALPNALGLCIALAIIDEAKRYLLYSIFIPAFAICIGLTYWQIRREIRLKLNPEKRALEGLRSQLVTDQ